jgi:hypothetical protein
MVPFEAEERSYYYPLTWGNFPKLYRSHCGEWQCVVTFYHNYHVTDVLLLLRLVYNMLSTGGLWIDVSTPSFPENQVPLSYKEYEHILEQSQFTLLEKTSSEDFWYFDQECIMN